MAESPVQIAIVCLGIFATMALSNAIVPVLPAFAGTSAWQGAVYAAYFFGAFVSTLPGGLLTDRYGTLPVMRTGLVLTLLSGAFLFLASSPVLVVVCRAGEGIGTGLFVASALAYVNSRPDHVRMSGYYMAMLNLGLVLGLLLSGWLAVYFSSPVVGIGFFTVCTAVALLGTAAAGRSGDVPRKERDAASVFSFIRGNLWLWYSAVVLVGITGVASSLYPDYSKISPDLVGFWIAAMSVATIVTVLVASRIRRFSGRIILGSSLLMAGAVLFIPVSPVAFVILGALAGVVMIAQMAFLAQVPGRQGLLMGLFSTASYLGMAILPFLAGIIADSAGFLMAFAFAAILGLTVAVATIGVMSSSSPSSE
ncbi:MFS transporter [Methanoregula sp. UBA64]|jgi:MFS family permease|uniref:MFS transporter n=1 Tax=Methanoregula sp. UBA64 TaxID=1915554 RepID=UPI0025EBD3DA|nr:MFS transporter [Methanoregula sp. UBA64]